MKTDEIRQTFLDFFRERGHKVWPSSSLIPEDPRAPLLTTAGMVQFIPYFLGEKPIDNPRAASCQVSARTTDIENVGRTARHMTTFEMLGNFSFGDYFKREAIEWAWELSTVGFGLDPDRIWVSVYETDDEAATIWREVVGVPDERIVRLGFEDNYWWMGVAGPGGPCSELYYDRGPAYGEASSFDEGEASERIIEFWNLVFTQHEVDERGSIVRDLPRRNVDTGLGLERMAAILQQVPTIWETDLLRSIIRRAEQISGRRYGEDDRSDVSLRILAEHARAAAFLIGDGVMPSNEDRGYVLRRLIRRAVRHARLLGVDQPVMQPLIECVVDVMGDTYPQLRQDAAYLSQVAGGEDTHFRGTLSRGMQMIEDEVRNASEGAIAGDVAFRLHDTYGFPLELTVEIAQEAGLEVDRDSFERLMNEQRERAREARRVDLRDEEALQRILATAGATLFTGYETAADEAAIVGLVSGGSEADAATEGDEVEVVLDRTPFYPEGGGQIGDAGTIEVDGGLLDVLDTQRRLGDLIVHRARVSRGEVRTGARGRAVVDQRRRAATSRSHTATHILHATLRAALGEHARQAGSLVEPGRLRFDFAHHSRVPRDLLDEVEQIVNERLSLDETVRPYETTMEEARSRGALMLFEEKYGDVVRVVEIGDYSVELCGGIHVARTSQVGAIKVLGEGSISTGVRRIEALSGAEAIEDFRRSRALLEHIAGLLRATPDEAPAKIEKLLADLKAAEQQLKTTRSAGQREQAVALARTARALNDVRVVVQEVPDLAVGELQKLAVAVRDEIGGAAAVVLGSASGDRAGIVATVDKQTAGRVKAPALIAEAAAAIGGGAGGRDLIATGGGKRADGLPEAMRLATEAVDRLLA